MGFSKAAKEAFEAALDMAHDARMARAKEMGFDTEKTWYHGSNQTFDAFETADKSGDFTIPNNLGDNIGAFFARQQSDAADFGANVGEYMLRLENPKRFKSQEDFRAFLGQHMGLSEDVRDAEGYIVREGQPYYRGRDVLESQGHDGVTINRPGYDTASDKPWAIAFHPEQIRSTNAAFDPAKKGSSNLLASLAGGGVLTGAMLPSEEAEAGVISKTLKAKYPDVNFWLSERGDKAVLDKVVIPEEMRNQGLGSKFMQDLTEMASKEGKTLALTPSADFGGNKKRLEEFYGRYGFKPNKGKNKDYEISEAMYRLPALAGLGALAMNPEDATAAELVQSTGPDRGTIASQLLALSQQGDANPDVMQNLNGSPLLVQLANGLENNTQSPLGESHVQGIVDLLRKWGYREQASPLDYGAAALDVMP